MIRKRLEGTEDASYVERSGRILKSRVREYKAGRRRKGGKVQEEI